MPVWEWIEESLELLGCVLAFAVILRHLEGVGVYDPARWRELARTSGPVHADADESPESVGPMR